MIGAAGLLQRMGYSSLNNIGGIAAYSGKAVMNDRSLIETAYDCGKDK